MECATANFFLAPPPGALGRGQKVKYHLISITKSISKIFIPNFVCVLTNERYKAEDRIFILSPGSCPRGQTLRRLGCPWCQKFIFFKQSHVAYQIDGDEEKNRTHVKFSSKGQILNFGYHVNFKDFYTKLCVFSHK